MKLYQDTTADIPKTSHPAKSSQSEQPLVPPSISMSSPDITTVEIEAIQEVLQTRWLSLGPKIEAFEQKLADYTGAAYAAGVNSGTSGLHLTLIAADIDQFDLVITTPFSFIASANVILYQRAIPVFVDVDPTTGNINPTLVAEAVDDLSRNKMEARHWLPPMLQEQPIAGRLKAIMPVHAFGQPVDMDPILTVAQQHSLYVIEDACEAIGSEYKSYRIGSLSDAAVFAFYPNKQITTGEGGMIVTNRENWADLFRSLRNQGRDVFNAWLNHTRLGYNYRLDEMSAALGLVQLQRIDEILAKRAQVASWYNERLTGLSWLQCPTVVANTHRMSWFVYVVKIKPPVNRDKIMDKLAEVNIPSRPYFTPIHLQPFYREKFGFSENMYPITESLGKRCLALPFSSVMTETEVDYVCTMLKRIPI